MEYWPILRIPTAVQQRPDVRHLHRCSDGHRRVPHQRHHRAADRGIRGAGAPHLPPPPNLAVRGPRRHPARLRGHLQRAGGVPAARHHRRARQRQPEPPGGLRGHRRLPLNHNTA